MNCPWSVTVSERIDFPKDYHKAMSNLRCHFLGKLIRKTGDISPPLAPLNLAITDLSSGSLEA